MPVPTTAPALWQAAPETARTPGSARLTHWPTLLHEAGGQDPHRDPDQRHASVRRVLQLALYADSMKGQTPSIQSPGWALPLMPAVTYDLWDCLN